MEFSLVSGTTDYSNLFQISYFTVFTGLLTYDISEIMIKVAMSRTN